MSENEKQPAPPGVLATLRVTPAPVRYLLSGVLVNQLGAFMQTFLALFLVHQRFPVGEVGIFLGAYSLGAVFGTLLGGELTHRLGARNTIITAMTGSAALVAAMPLLAEPGRELALAAVVAGAGAITQAYRPAASAMLTELMPEEHRVMAFSMLRIALNVGAAVGPLVAAVLIGLDWSALFWFDAGTALLYALVAAVLLPRTAVGKQAPALPTDRAPEKKAAGSYAVVLRDHRYLLYLLGMLLSAIVYIQSMAMLPLQLTEGGHSPRLYSAVLVTSSLLVITCELKITSYVQSWRPAVAGGLGIAVMGLGLAGYALAPQAAAVVLGLIVLSDVGLMVSGPTTFAHPAKQPAEHRARYLAASQAMFGLGSAVGPAIGVFAWDHLGAPAWWLCGAVALLSAAATAAGLREPAAAPARPAAETVSA
ncbi:MFS transporter [Kitasatospora sp. NPDC059571]|uniref:MFS transporter n=1 Tax=Kitasatospora sp. NPDC059571 TaxID=3346871 RepID=UPI0036CEC54C